MSDIAVKYPLDITGTKVSNKVENEIHALNGRKVRAIVLDHGLYFSKSLVVVDLETNAVLTRGEQYRSGEMDVELTARYGKEISGIVLITDETLNGPVSITYQALGGEQSYSAKAILVKIAEADLDGKPVPFDDLIGRPMAYKPAAHKTHSATLYGMEYFTKALGGLKHAIEVGNKGANDALKNYVSTILLKAKNTAAIKVGDVMAAHLAAPNPHSDLVLKVDVASMLAFVRRPFNVSPAPGNQNTALETALTGYKYQSLYGLAQGGAHFQVSLTNDFSGALVYDRALSGAGVVFQPDTLLLPSKTYFWRCRYKDIENVWSEWSDVTSFNTAAITIAKPTLLAPVPGAQTNTETPTITTSAFAISGATDTHAATDWEVWTGPNGTGTRVWSSINDVVKKTTTSVSPGILVQNGTYYARARHKGTKYGYSDWSNDVSFIAKWDPRPTVVGQSFGGGYYAGDFTIGVATYAVIVAPKSSGETQKVLTGDTGQTTNTSAVDSVANTAALVSRAIASSAIPWVKGLTIGGYNDWVIPAQNVWNTIYNNLKPSGTTTPAAFKTGGAEAFAASYYWTSTAYNWVDSWQDDPTPNYGWVTRSSSHSESAWYGPSDGTTPTPHCSTGTVTNVRYGYFYSIDPSTGQPGSLNSTYWSCTWQSYEIVSYTPGETYYQNYYEGYLKHMGNGGATYQSKNGTGYVRAIRLVRVA